MKSILSFIKGLFKTEVIIVERCNHNEWDCDTQIKVIKCKGCGKTAWLDQYKDLYTGFPIGPKLETVKSNVEFLGKTTNGPRI